MQYDDLIKAMEQHAADFGLKLSSIGQMAVRNRHAYDNLKRDVAQGRTASELRAWLDADRARRTERAGAA
jgi:hypothetical protein